MRSLPKPVIKPIEPLQSTDIGDYPLSWEINSLGSLFEVQQGKALSQAARRGISPRPFLRTVNVLWGKVDLTTVDQMDFTDDEAKRLSLQPDDLLVCEGGEIGRSAVWSHPDNGFSYQNHIHRLRRKTEEIVPAFVMYWMQAGFLILRLYGGVGNRTTIPNLSGTRLKQLLIPVPPLPEQRAIAAVLSKIQAAMQVQDKIVATLKELKAATMAKLFREGLRGEPLKQTEIGEIPESWEIVKLGNHCRVQAGGTPSRKTLQYWDGNIPWVKTGEINYRSITGTEEHITEAGLRNSSARLIPKGTLLIAMYGQGVTRGRVAFLEIEASTNQACAALFPDENLYSGYLYAHCTFAYNRIRELGHGANQKNLSAEIIKGILLPVPKTIHEQREIYSIVKIIESMLQMAEGRHSILNHLFSSMLHLLMTGRVRVTRLMQVKR